MPQGNAQQSRARMWLVPALVVLAVIGLGVAAAISGSGNATTTPGGGSANADVTVGTPSAPATDDPLMKLARRQPDDPLARGRADAPVVMVEYSDFQCPFCGKYARDTEPTLVDKYVSSGVLRIEWRDFPYLGPESMTAALAGRAAAAQGKFWQFHQAAYAEQHKLNAGVFDENGVRAIAKRIGLDLTRFEADMNSPATKKAVEADLAQGQSVGVSGTPSFVINGYPVVGAQPLESFEQIIEAMAKAAGKPVS